MERGLQSGGTRPGARRGWRVPGAGLAVVLALLAGGSSPVLGGPALTPVRMGSVPDVGFMVLYVAMAKGLYRAHGLDVSYQAIPGGGKVNQALVTGAIDAAGIGDPDAVLSYLAGRPVRIVQALYTHEFIELVVRQDLRGKVKTVRDLRGLRIGVSSAGSISWAFARLMVARAGLNPSTDVSLVFVGAPTTMYTALRSGKIDAAAAWEPLPSTAIAQHQGYILASLLDPAEHERIVGASRSLALDLLVRTETITRTPQVVRALVAADREAIQWIRGHPTAALVQVLKRYFPSAPTAILTRAVERRMVGLPTDGSLSEADYIADTTALQKAGVLKSRPPFREIVDCDFAGCRP
jgi:NitT/TauT family transport system substrate-binding protein